MMNVCIVEDEKSFADEITNYIKTYEKNSSETFHITHLYDGLDLVEDYQSQFDIILLDIQMKHMDGMKAAEKIRAIDKDVIIIFITSTVQYAVQGYMVDALGYVLKPVSFAQFQQIFDKAVEKVSAKKKHVYIKVYDGDRQLKINCDSVYCIESQRNNVILHTAKEDYVTAGPLKKFESMLLDYGFSKCHNAYIINLSFVEGVQKEEVLLTNGKSFPISRAKKKEFMTALAEDII